jgi:hypothetical protein
MLRGGCWDEARIDRKGFALGRLRDWSFRCRYGRVLLSGVARMLLPLVREPVGQGNDARAERPRTRELQRPCVASVLEEPLPAP